MLSPTHPFCTDCKQDLIRDCPETLPAFIAGPCPVALIRRLVAAAEQARLTGPDLLDLLHSGASIRSILDLIEQRLKRQTEQGNECQRFCA